MRCPFCQATLAETQPSCGGCGISIEKMDAMLGAAPAIQGGLSDGAGLLSKKDRRRVQQELREFPNTLPQLRVSIATFRGIPDKLTLSAYTFWLFNRSDIVRKFDKGGRNYDVLITIDGAARNSAMMVGYGLEPFVGKHHLDAALATGHGHLVADLYGPALLTIIDALRETLKKIAQGIPEAFALPQAPVVEAKTIAEAALDF